MRRDEVRYFFFLHCGHMIWARANRLLLKCRSCKSGWKGAMRSCDELLRWNRKWSNIAEDTQIMKDRWLYNMEYGSLVNRSNISSLLMMGGMPWRYWTDLGPGWQEESVKVYLTTTCTDSSMIMAQNRWRGHVNSNERSLELNSFIHLLQCFNLTWPCMA